MTKIYDIVHLNGQSYMVDKEAGTLKVNDYYYCDGKLGKVWGKTDWTLLDSPKVIASTDPSLGLPLLPAVEEDVEALAKEVYPVTMVSAPNSRSDYFPYDTNADYRKLWIEGYKAAKAKRYTEEDMEAAVCFGMTLERFKTDKGKLSDTEEFKGFLQSLNPLPKQVEVEMVSVGFGKDDNVPRVNENNFVVVKRWI